MHDKESSRKYSFELIKQGYHKLNNRLSELITDLVTSYSIKHWLNYGAKRVDERFLLLIIHFSNGPGWVDYYFIDN